MVNRKEITSKLSILLEEYLNPHKDTRIYIAKEVTFNYGRKDECRVDYMRYKPKNNTVSGIEQGMFYAYEIKSSVEDFNSGHGTNWDIADYSYIVTLPDVYASISRSLPYWVGCIVPSDKLGTSMEVIKKAKAHDRTKPCSEMLLMMFRSANRDVIKKYGKKDD